MTKYPELFASLAAPFGAGEVKTRNQGGRVLSYVTARSVMNRLDSVLGPENWWARFEIASADSVLCYLTVRLPDGSEVTKSDVGGCAGMADAGDDDKSAASDGLKRAAVCFGVGRHLYGDGVPDYGTEPTPAHTTPEPTPDPLRRRPLPGEKRQCRDEVLAAEPKDGRALYRWAKDLGERLRVDLVKHLNCEGKLRHFPPRLIDWSPAEVAVGVLLVRELPAVQAGDPRAATAAASAN